MKVEWVMESLMWPVALLLTGIALICLEIFIPSAGLLGVLAAAAVVSSIVLAFSHSLAAGTLMLLVATIAVPIVVAIAIKSWPHTPIGKLLLIKRPEHEDEVLPDTDEYHRRDRLVGKRGVAKTELLPSGDVVVEGCVYDAVSNGVVIGAGQAIRVIDINTQRLVVRPLSEAEIAVEKASPDILSTPIDSLGIDPFNDPLA
jgi:membrane-bound ClpP family serine protease